MDILKGLGLRKFWIVRKLLEWSKPKKISYDGHIFYLNRADTGFLNALKQGSYEEEETEICKRLVKKGDVVFDVGANIGYFTLLLVRLVGSKGTVYAFEPDLTNFSRLNLNVKVNGYENIRCFNVAISDHSGTGHLYLNDYNMGDHRIYDSKNGREKIPIELRTMDEFETHPDFVKMDIQGSEVMALRGAKKTLKKTKNLLIEYWPYGLEKAGFSGEELLNLLKEYGFSHKTELSHCTPNNEEYVDIHATRP